MALWFILQSAATPALADGKMYMAREKVPVSIPYQRAAILFDQNTQTLILQSQYKVPGSGQKHSLGWVVPVPAVPEIASMDADIASHMFRTTDFISRPSVTRISGWLLMAGFCGTFAAALILWILSFFNRWKRKKQQMRKFAKFLLLLFMAIFVFASMFATAGIRDAKGVEIIKSVRAGIFDVEVVRAETASTMIDWLRRNEFDFGKEDEKAIQSYIERKWCFVVSKVTADIDPTNTSAVSEGLVAPLVLQFKTPGPVYPTALTATGGHSTEILIYLASREPFKTPAPLECKFRGEIPASRTIREILRDAPGGLSDMLPKNATHLNKFKATLAPAQMAQDIEFLPDPGAPAFREHLYRW